VKRLHPRRIPPSWRQPGFTLAELAIVLVIVALLLGGLLMPLTMQTDLRRISDTKKSMDEIKEALIGFALANGRLPCPASATAIDGVTATAGTELLTGNTCTSVTGVIPWVTLNVAETDQWGRRFTYRVTSIFAHTIAGATFACGPPINPQYSSFALCAVGDMKVQSRNPSTKGLYDMTSVSLPAVFISAGKNGYGAYTSQGTLYAAVPASNADETTNATAATVAFISRDKADVSSPCSDTAGATAMCEFDDLIAWIPLTTLMNRMVVSGKLP
jgi:prepilin-type N-terminal cleavage/methylation domain-containing protein